MQQFIHLKKDYKFQLKATFIFVIYSNYVLKKGSAVYSLTKKHEKYQIIMKHEKKYQIIMKHEKKYQIIMKHEKNTKL